MGKKVKVTITRVVDVTEMGRAGGKARAEKLSADELSEQGRNAVQARWDRYYKAHPEKLKAKLEREAKRGTEKRGRPGKRVEKGPK